MILLNKINYKNKLFQVIMDDKQNRLILEIKNNSNFYYMYPEFDDLIGITKQYFATNNVVYIKNTNNDKFIKIAQKVLISGIIVSIVLSVPKDIKSYALQTIQSSYNSIVEIIPNTISTPEELKQEFDTKSITKYDVHKVIDENEKLNNFNDIIHEFVNDVDRYNPDQNWWIFYNNIKRMNINYNVEVSNADGTFNPKTAELSVLDTLKDDKLKIILRHELTHALSLIDTKIDNKNVEISFNNTFSGYGRSVMELLTCGFNSNTGKYIDPTYRRYNFLFQPLINKMGPNNFYDVLFKGDINSFASMCDPYFENTYKYITHLDAVFYEDNGGDFMTKRITDTEFLINFRNMTIDFFVNLQHEQLKSGNISYNYYINNRIEYINSLQEIINNVSKEPISLSDSYKYLNELENKIFDYETLSNIEKISQNRNDLLITFSYSNKSNEFKSIRLDSFENNYSKEHYNDLNTNNINDFYFIVEEINNNFKLRLINKNNPEYYNIDIFTYKYIEDTSNIILEIPVIDYINSLPKEKILGENWSNEDYFTTINFNSFNVNEIIEFANAQNYNNKSR